MTIEPQPAGPTFARCALRGPVRDQIGRTATYIYTRNLKFAQLVTELASLAINNYRENSDNSTDKGGSLRSPIIFIGERSEPHTYRTVGKNLRHIYIYVFYIYIYIYTFVRRARARYAQTSDRPVEVQRSI